MMYSVRVYKRIRTSKVNIELVIKNYQSKLKGKRNSRKRIHVVHLHWMLMVLCIVWCLLHRNPLDQSIFQALLIKMRCEMRDVQHVYKPQAILHSAFMIKLMDLPFEAWNSIEILVLFLMFSFVHIMTLINSLSTIVFFMEWKRIHKVQIMPFSFRFLSFV